MKFKSFFQQEAYQNAATRKFSRIYATRILSATVIAIVLFINPACESFTEVAPPKTQLITETVFQDDLTATAAVLGLYYYMGATGFSGGGQGSISYLGALLADESILQASIESYRQANNNALVSTNSAISSTWSDCYNRIYHANLIIEALDQSVGLTPSTQSHLEGEAKFLRAFAHFYLVNLFGDVPYITTTDYRVNTLVERTARSDVYAGIIQDLTDAQVLLADQYINSEKGRVNKSAALALLARVYLYIGDWHAAESNATLVISNGMYGLADPDDVFLKNSSEAIWQLIPANSQMNNYTNDGNVFTRTTSISLRTQFAEASFEPGDLRRQSWVGLDPANSRYFSFKYKERPGNATGAEYSMVIRLAEIYLIRAEARAMQNNLTGQNSAASDVNMIRARAGLTDITATAQGDILLAIEQERKVELFNEWGHRWFDLVRTGRATALLSLIKPDWTETDILFPIPESEMLINPNLKPQNPGY